VFLVGTFSAAVALAAFLNYSVTVKAPANIRPLGELRIVQAASEGSSQSIEVKENQVVRKGDAIAIMTILNSRPKKSQLQGNIQQSHYNLLKSMLKSTPRYSDYR